MRMHFFSKGDMSVASSRLRAFNLARRLERYGIPTAIYNPPTPFTTLEVSRKRLAELSMHVKALTAIPKSDIIFLQRTIYQKEFIFLALCLRLFFRKRYIFDFDDAIFLHFPLGTALLTKFATCVLVGSHYLYDYANKYNKNVYLMPTLVDLAQFESVARPQRREEVVIGWVGDAPAHLDNLVFMANCLRQIKAQNVIFRLVGAKASEEIYGLFRGISGIVIDMIDWVDPLSIQKEIAKFDIGVMPLVESEWAKGKCALKLIEYMATGLPVVASPVGENRFVVENGKHGFLPATIEEWVAYLNVLISDSKLRATMGDLGRQRVASTYSYEARIPDLVTIIKRHF